MDLDKTIKALRVRLTKNLPAHHAHQKVMKHRNPIHQKDHIPSNARKSAVLALLYPKNEVLHTVFILRQSYPGVHSAQIGFPGGKVELGDKDLTATALREAEEELNIKPKELEVLGALTPLYVPPSNFIIHPYLAYQSSIPEFIPQEREVAKILECPVQHLLVKRNFIDSTVSTAAGNMKVRGFQLNEHIIWGATGMMVKEMTELMEGIITPT